ERRPPSPEPRGRVRVGAVGIATAVVVVLAGCGASQVKVVGAAEPEYENRSPKPQHVHRDSTIELPGDEQIVEPDHPAVAPTQERALAHIHPRKGVGSGVVVGPRLVLTAHQGVAPEARGPIAVGADKPHRVEVASSTLTWTNRAATHAVVPA